MDTTNMHWFDTYCIHHNITQYGEPPTSNRGYFYVDMAGPTEEDLIFPALAEFYKQLNGYHNVWLRVRPSVQKVTEADDVCYRCRFRGVYW